MSIKQQYKDNIVVHLDPRKGTFKGQSGTSIDGTATNSPQWSNSESGKTIYFTGVIGNSAPYVGFGTDSIGDAINGASAVTVMMWVNPNGLGDTTSGFMLSGHVDAGDKNGLAIRADNLGDTFDLVVGGRSQGADTFQSHSGGTYNSHQRHCIIAVFDFANDTISVDVDGTNDGETAVSFGSDTYTQGTGGATDTIGLKAQTAGTLDGHVGGHYGECIIFNTGLTSQERSQLYEESLQEAFIGLLPKHGFKYPRFFTGNEDGLVDAWNMENIGDTIYDVGSGGNHLTKVGSSQAVVSPIGAVQKYNGTTGYHRKAIANFRSGDSSGAVEMVFVLHTIQATTLFSASDEATTANLFAFGCDTSGYPRMFHRAANQSDIVIGDTVLPTDTLIHVLFVSSGTSYSMFVNGVEQTLSIVAGGNTGDWFADISGMDNITTGAGLSSAGSGGASNATMLAVGVYNDIKDGDYAAERVAKLSGMVVYANNFVDYPVTIGSSGPIRDFEVQSGSYKISDSDDASEKWLECVTDGCIMGQYPVPQQSGEWILKMNKPDAEQILWLFMMEDKATFNASGQNGYFFQYNTGEAWSIQKTVNGTNSIIWQSELDGGLGDFTADQDWFVKITRNALTGEFTVYSSTDGKTWDLVSSNTGGGYSNPFTNTSFLAPFLYHGFDNDTGCKVTRIIKKIGIV